VREKQGRLDGRVAAGLFSLVLASACGLDEEERVRPPEALPSLAKAATADPFTRQVQAAVQPVECADYEALLRRLGALAERKIRYAGGGEMSLKAEAFARLSHEERRRLAWVLASVAACPAGRTEEAVITFRELGTGKVLARGRVAEF
jgi:hypothetical protein